MTVAVGFLAGKGDHSELYLAVEAARTLNTSLTVVTVVPRPWLTPSKARIDAEYAAYAEQLATESARAAKECISELTDGVEVGFRKVPHRSVSGGLIEAATDLGADVLVLGSAADGPLGRVMVGSTADRLLHSSPVPLAIAPQGYRGSNGAGLSRITCAYPATAETVPVVQRVAELAERLGVPMRVLTFAVRGRTMYPPEVGLRAEDSILEAWTEQARDALAQLQSDGIVGPDVELEVVAGDGWSGALENAHWLDGELLALGTSPTGAVARVFLGSRGTKIVRYSPVPVLVLPG